MTEYEIIRCLRHCRAGDCENCKALNVCDATFSFHKEALGLINRQKAEVERLEKVLNGRDQLINALNKCYKQAKSEAIKEFAERLKKSDELYNCIRAIGNVNKVDCIIDAFDNLVKEMTEVNEND